MQEAFLRRAPSNGMLRSCAEDSFEDRLGWVFWSAILVAEWSFSGCYCAPYEYVSITDPVFHIVEWSRSPARDVWTIRGVPIIYKARRELYTLSVFTGGSS
jgi:hypothetical protein